MKPLEFSAGIVCWNQNPPSWFDKIIGNLITCVLAGINLQMDY